MALQAVKDALKNLVENSSTANTDDEKDKPAVIRDVFCFEDTFASKDLKVTVKNVGDTPFPLPEDFIKQLIDVSSKAKFGQGEATVLDTQVRDTQMIPASDLTVDIDKECLENLLTRAKAGLNLTQKCTLEPHLHNMLVYGPGQFFKMHKDSEKVPNMVATLVIVLPSVYKGGDLVIQHNNSNHFFFGSQSPNFIKCIMFYSDCLHEIRPVIEGYRVAITYNIVLEPLNETVEVDDALNDAIKDYFSLKNEKPLKLIFALDHEYSETNLRWGLLKGQDRTCAFALLAVAKNQNLIPSLALGRHRQLFDVGWETDIVDQDIALYHFVDEWNSKSIEKDVVLSKSELCLFSQTEDILEPYAKVGDGPTGNEGNTVNYWYRRGFVVLCSSKWHILHSYKKCLWELHKSVTTQEGVERVLIEEIHKMKNNIIQVKYWKDPEVIRYLVDIVLHLKDQELAVSILSNMPKQITQPERIDWFLKLEEQFDDVTWMDILKKWSFDSETLPPFFEGYLKHPLRKSNSFIIKYLAEQHVGQDKLFFFGKRDRQYLCDLAIYLNDKKMTVSILSKFPEEIINPDRIERILKLENQFDDETWINILENWTNPKPNCSDLFSQSPCNLSKVPSLIEEYLKHPSRKPNSNIIRYLSEKHLQQFLDKNKDYGTDSNYDLSFDYKYLRKKAEKLWMTFKMCFDLGNSSLENKLIQHVSNNPITFQPKTLLEFLVLLQSKLPLENLDSYKCLRDLAIQCLQTRLAQFNNEHFWEVKKEFHCWCKFCLPIHNFLLSKETQKYCLSADSKARKHTSRKLKTLEQEHFLVISTDNSKNIPSLLIEKDNRVFQENKTKVAVLTEIKKKLEEITFSEGEANLSEEYLRTSPEKKERYKKKQPLKVEMSESPTKKKKSE